MLFVLKPNFFPKIVFLIRNFLIEKYLRCSTLPDVPLYPSDVPLSTLPLITPCMRGKVDPGPDLDNERLEAIWSHSLKKQKHKRSTRRQMSCFHCKYW